MVSACSVVGEASCWIVVFPHAIGDSLSRLVSKTRVWAWEAHHGIEDIVNDRVQTLRSADKVEPRQSFLGIRNPDVWIHVDARLCWHPPSSASVLKISVDQAALRSFPEDFFLVAESQRGGTVQRGVVGSICSIGRLLFEGSLVLKPPGLVSHHTSPAASYPDGILLRKNILPACCRTSACKVWKEGYARDMPIEVAGSEAVVVLESVDEVEGASCGVIGATCSVDVGCEEELDSVDCVEVDVIQVQDLVKLDSLVVNWSQCSISYFGKKGNSL